MASSKHREIVLWMRRQIEFGTWDPHHQLPSEPDLAAQLQAARGTVQKAVDELVGQRRLYRIRGKGTFVSEPAIEPALTQSLLSLSEALDLEGVSARTDVVAVDVINKAALWVLDALRLSDDHEVVKLVRTKTLASGTFALLENYLETARFPGIQRVDFATNRLFDVVEQQYGCPIDWGTRLFDIEAAGTLVARRLHLAPSSPVLRLEQVTYTVGNIPVECSRVWLRPDKMRLSAVLRREHG